VLAEETEAGAGGVRLSSEQVSDFFERHGNHFPALEEAAEHLWREAGLDDDALFGQLKQFMEQRCRASVSVQRAGDMGGAVRRYDTTRRELHLSDALLRGSRTFQLALQIGLLTCGDILDRLTDDPTLRSEGSRDLCRVALASYFAAAVIMPYTAFLAAAESARYDVELLSRRFGLGWEQTCHRLTTLRRPGAEGVSFYLLRVDMAGNISKRFSAAGIRFPRFSGLCALWNVHGAFAQPGRVRVQLSRLPNGHAVLAIARTVRRQLGASYHTSEVLYSVGIGCDVAEGRRLVYADAINLDSPEGAVPIGITCRLCERMHCTARAFPNLREPLRIDENVRGISFFAPVIPQD
jgi:predicted transcriptional regulator